MMWNWFTRLFGIDERRARKRVKVEIPMERHKSATQLYDCWTRENAGHGASTRSAPKAREDAKDS